MKNPKAVADRIAELHNEGVKSSVKRIEDAKRSVEEASTLGEKGIWLVENAVEDASARTTEETVELGHKLAGTRPQCFQRCGPCFPYTKLYTSFICYSCSVSPLEATGVQHYALKPKAEDCVMHRSEAQFCRDEAERLLNLARQTTDSTVREDITRMATEWAQRAKAKEVSPAMTVETERPLPH